VNRRSVITALGGAAAWPLAARAQQPERMRRVGVLMNMAATDTDSQAYVAAFAQGLRQLGWVEGQNLRIDVRWNAGDTQLARIYGAQLIGLDPDVILAASTTNLTVIRQATSTIPVVFLLVSDPVEQGFVANLAKPGGNITGFSQYEFSIGGKWLALLKEIAPALERVAVMFNPDTSPQSKFFMRSIEAAAPGLFVRSIVVPVRSANEIEVGVENFARQANGGLLLPTDSFTGLHQKLIIEAAGRHRLPAISWSQNFPKDGGLLYYGSNVSLPRQFQQAAGYVDRILKGEKPADMPVQAPTKFELVINLKTAKALGLEVPPTLLARADEVIE
jgi:ABC-type uncharacterized transport system substrate-binding protein